MVEIKLEETQRFEIARSGVNKFSQIHYLPKMSKFPN